MINNRTGWARTYLNKAGMLTIPGRGMRLPVLRLIYHARLRQPITVETLDLSRPQVQDRIEKVVDPEYYGIDVRGFLA